MACETPVVVGSRGFEGLIPDQWVVPQDDAPALAEALKRLVQLPEEEYRALGATERAAIVATQDLGKLADAIMSRFRV